MRTRVGLSIAIIVALGGIVVVIAGLQSARRSHERMIVARPSAQEQDVSDRVPRQLQDLSMDGLEVTQKGPEGNLLWKMHTAGKFDFDHNNQVVAAADIHWELTRPGAETLIVEAARFTANYPERTFTFAQGVRASTPSGSQRFEVPELVYRFDTQKLIAEGPVKFLYGRYETAAGRLVIDNQAKEARFSGGVRFARMSGQ